MAIGKLDAPVTLFHQVSLRLFGKDLSELPNNQPGVIALRDFGYLPYCVIIVIIFAGKEMRYQRFLMSILLLLPAPTLYYYYRHLAPEQWSTLALPVLFYGLALIVFMMRAQLERFSMRIIKSLINTGSISYGLYIIHYPILYLFGHNNFFSGTPFTFLVRLICFLVLAISGAYLLEKKFQPWIKKLFF
jgi:peptidoglycan/LPS O-acetylase OafA/YrhL